jgi:Tubulin like
MSKYKIRRAKQIAASSKQPQEQDNDKRYVITAVGGGLQQAALAMWQEILQDEQLSKQVRVAFVDTDANNLEYLPPNIKFVMDQIPAAELLEAIKLYPGRYPGWEMLGDLDQKWNELGAAERLPAGLMTQRGLGPLVLNYVLWRRSQSWRNFSLYPVRELHQAHKMACWQARCDRQKPLELTISYFFSSCGGTGSSLAILIEDMQRFFLNTDMGLRLIPGIADILVPGSMLHRATDPPALKANTYAFLLELMARYEQRAAVLQLASYKLPQSHRPFQDIYFYDESNLKKRMFASREELNDVVQEVWKLRHLGQEGQEYQSRKVDYHLKYPNIACSAGCCILEFPTELIETRCALRSSLAWLSAQPLYPVQHDAQSHLWEFLNQTPGVRDVASFTRDAAGKTLRVNLTEFQTFPRQTLSTAIDAYAHRRLPQLQSVLQELAIQEINRLGTRLVEQVRDLLNQRSGPMLATAFLQALDAFLTERQTLHETQVNRVREQRERRGQRLERYHTGSWWQRLSLAPRANYLALREQLLVTQFDEQRQLARLQVFTQLRKLVKTLHAECDNWHFTLTVFQQRLSEELDEILAKALEDRSVVVEWVVCESEMDALYEAGQEQALRQATAELTFTWQPEDGTFRLTYGLAELDSTTSWAIVSETGIGKHVGYFRQFWSTIADQTVEEILRKQDKTPAEVLAWLLNKAAPLIRIDDVSQLPAEKMLNILGSQTQAFWQEYIGETGLSIVATGNPHRISMLSTLQGFNPLEGLMQSSAWKQAYEDALAAGRSPHLFPETSIGSASTAPVQTNGHRHPKSNEEVNDVVV